MICARKWRRFVTRRKATRDHLMTIAGEDVHTESLTWGMLCLKKGSSILWSLVGVVICWVRLSACVSRAKSVGVGDPEKRDQRILEELNLLATNLGKGWPQIKEGLSGTIDIGIIQVRVRYIQPMGIAGSSSRMCIREVFRQWALKDGSCVVLIYMGYTTTCSTTWSIGFVGIVIYYWRRWSRASVCQPGFCSQDNIVSVFGC